MTPASTGTPLLRLRDLRREFPAGDDTIAVLRDVNLDIAAGEIVAIVGQSGSGKSTLMNILGCLDRPTRGSYQVAGRETGSMEPANWPSCAASISASFSSATTCSVIWTHAATWPCRRCMRAARGRCVPRVPSSCCSGSGWATA